MRKKGFTLIEIAMVITILSLLTVLTTPQYFRLKEKAAVTADDVNIKILKTIVETYQGENLEYPVNLGIAVTAYFEKYPNDPYTGDFNGYEIILLEDGGYEIQLKTPRETQQETKQEIEQEVDVEVEVEVEQDVEQDV